jgi:hypothetical protein
MMNPFKEVNWKPGPPELRSFGRSLMIGFPIVAVVLFIIAVLRTWSVPVWPLWVALGGFGVGAICRTVPAVAPPFYYLWYGFGCSMGFIITNVVISAIYYLVFAPIGFCLRATGRDPMERKFLPVDTTYWKDAEKITDSERYFRQY